MHVAELGGKCRSLRVDVWFGLSPAAGWNTVSDGLNVEDEVVFNDPGPDMDLAFILSAAIFTLLAIVVATSLLNGSSSSRRCADPQRCAGPLGSGLDQSEPKQNGHVPDNWSEISGSSHDHWDVVKSVLSVNRLFVCLRHCLLICSRTVLIPCPARRYVTNVQYLSKIVNVREEEVYNNNKILLKVRIRLRKLQFQNKC